MFKNIIAASIHIFFINLIIAQDRVITTGVPFLLITPDARAAGMGDIGVATSADTYSQQWNPSKYVFCENSSGFGISYTPYLSKLVDDIFLANLTYFNKNNTNAWGVSLKYFSLGDIQFNEIIGQTIVDQGLQSPNELTLDFSYSLLLSKNFSSSVAARFIYSDLKLSTDVDPSSASTVGFDISAFYKSEKFQFFGKSSIFRTGINISNIGPRLKYDEGGQMNFIPTNLKFGIGLSRFIDSDNKISFNTEFNKLLVPTPVPFFDENNSLLTYRQPNVNFLKGIFRSFDDAPDGITEELKEITWAIGLEYSFNKAFFFRTGYFNESLEKGARKFFTLGTGFDLEIFKIDISYLFSNSKIRNPLENTLRFSLAFNLSKKQTELSED